MEILFSHKMEGNPAVCDNMDRTWESYAGEINQRQMLYIVTYVWNLKKEEKLIEREIRFVVTSNYKINKHWEYSIQQRDCS